MIGVKYEYVGRNAAALAFPTICTHLKSVNYSFETCFVSPKNSRLGSTPDGVCYDAYWKSVICVVEVKCMKWSDHVSPPLSFPQTRSKSDFVRDKCRLALAQLHLHMFCCSCKYGILSFVTKKKGCSCFLISFDPEYFRSIVEKDDKLVAPSVHRYKGKVWKRRVEESNWLRTNEDRDTVTGCASRINRLTSRNLV
jgi:hypothetical protein